MRRRFAAALSAGVVLAAGIAFTAVPAAAHAVLTGSTPEDGATSDEPPTEVVLEFNEPVRVDFTQVAVLDAGDNQHNVGEPQVVGSTVTQAVGSLEPGEYRISYRVGSADGHPVSGVLTFTLAGEAGEMDDTADSGDADAADDEVFAGGAGLWLGLAAAAAAATMLILLIVRRPGSRGPHGGSDTGT